MLQPLSFVPVYKDYPWGGRAFETRLGREIPRGVVAEAWEISAHPNGPTPVRSGPLAGQSLAAVQRRYGSALVGHRNRHALERDRFPLLVKLLDAHSWLSVQVHPDDRYALAHHGDLGKTEMWVVLHAEPGAEIIYGLRRGVDREALAEALAAGRVESVLHRVAVLSGDVFFVPPGSIHALGPGLLLAEIQQASDVTFRLFDWDRDSPGRSLHVDEALRVTDFERVEPGAVEPRRLATGEVTIEALCSCPHFATERFVLAPGAAYAAECDGATLEIWGAIEGRATLRPDGAEPLELAAVDWLLLPAELGDFTLASERGARLLRVRTPEPAGAAAAAAAGG